MRSSRGRAQVVNIPVVTVVMGFVLGLSVGCMPSDPDSDATGTGGKTSGGAGGTTAGTGGSGSGGAAAPGTGGSGTGGAVTPGTGGSGSGGAMAGTGGGTSSGGRGGDAAGGRGGNGTPSGGTGGNGTSGGGGGSGAAAKPSAGCSKGTGRPANGTVSTQTHYFAFPASYDGTKPLPVLIGFHGCGSNNRGTDINSTEFIRLAKGTPIETSYIQFVPISSATGGCWTYGTDVSRVKTAFTELLTNYCVDTGRVYGTGHSSGAQFIVQMLRQNSRADAQHFNFKGVAPVAASDYGALAGPIAVMYIQGMMDRERGNGDGKEVVQQFRTANSCMSTSMPYSAVMGCQSSGTMVNPGCVIYNGCSAPTVWCSHNDPAYSGTMHGVPCFGMKAMYDFFNTL